MALNEQLFPEKKPAMPMTPNSQLSEVATRLRLAEEKYGNLRKRNQITEESLLSFEKDIRSELRVLGQRLSDVRKHVLEVNQKVDAMLGELSTVVHKHEFKAVERYIDMWQPLRFVTQDEAKRLVGREDNA